MLVGSIDELLPFFTYLPPLPKYPWLSYSDMHGFSSLIHNIVTRCHLRFSLISDGLLERIGGVDGEISEGGKNLSHGEKQVISILRVIVQKPKASLCSPSHLQLTSFQTTTNDGLHEVVCNCCSYTHLVYPPMFTVHLSVNLNDPSKTLPNFIRVLFQVVLIDEATAHLDLSTHKRMLNLLRERLPECTLLSIVHNLSGLDQYDRVRGELCSLD